MHAQFSEPRTSLIGELCISELPSSSDCCHVCNGRLSNFSVRGSETGVTIYRQRQRRVRVSPTSWLEVTRFSQKRNYEPRFLQRNRFIYLINHPMNQNCDSSGIGIGPPPTLWLIPRVSQPRTKLNEESRPPSHPERRKGAVRHGRPPAFLSDSGSLSLSLSPGQILNKAHPLLVRLRPPRRPICITSIAQKSRSLMCSQVPVLFTFNPSSCSSLSSDVLQIVEKRKQLF